MQSSGAMQSVGREARREKGEPSKWKKVNAALALKSPNTHTNEKK